MFQYFDSEVTRTQFRTSVDSNVMASGRELQPDASASWHCMGFLGQLGEGRSWSTNPRFGTRSQEWNQPVPDSHMHVCMSLQRRLQPNAERAILFRSWLAALKGKEDEEEEEEEDWPEGVVSAVYHRFPSYWSVCRWMYLACFRSEQGACIKLISQMMKYVRGSVCVICRAYVPILNIWSAPS